MKNFPFYKYLGHSNAFRKAMGACSLWIVPLLFLPAFFILSDVRGPIYLGMTFDPDYAYLANALSVLHLRQGMLVQHPGIPTEIYGAIVIGAKWLVRRVLFQAPDLDTDVLANSESYLFTLTFSTLLIFCGLLYFCGRQLERKFGSLMPPLLFQSLLFLIPETLFSLVRFSAEAPLLVAGLLFMICLAREEAAQDFRFGGLRESGMAGATVGLGIAVKMTFFPALCAFFLATTRKQRLAFGFGALISLIVLTAPAWGRYREIGRWYMEIATHRGVYGEKEIGAPTFQELLSNVASLFGNSKVFAVLTLSLLCHSAFCAFQGGPASLNSRIIHLCAIMVLVGILVTAKSSHNTRYLVPVMMIAAFGVTVLISSTVPAAKRNLIAILAISGFFILSASEVKAWCQQHIAYSESVARTRREISEHYSNCIEIGYYRSSSLGYALAFGNVWAWSGFSKTVQALHLDIPYLLPGPQIRSIDNPDWIPTILGGLHEKRCYILVGQTFDTLPSFPSIRAKQVFDGGAEAIYRLELKAS